MEIKKITTGPFWTNTYLIENNSKYLLVDPSFDLLDKLKIDLNKIEAILLTHGHIDHIATIDIVNKPIYIYKDEADFLVDSKLNLAAMFQVEYDSLIQNKVNLLKNNEIISLIGLDIKVIHTPGHTKGSVCYLINNDLFTGDTLFQMGKGRTDFITGDETTLNNSLKLLMTLDKQLVVHPGHGEDTTIGFEKEYNPFIKAIR